MSGQPYSPDEIDAVMNRYASTSTRLLAGELGTTLGRLYRLANLLDLRKSRECIAEQARENANRPDHGFRRTQFRRGSVPPNKGLKMPAGWAPGRMRESQFKKGSQPLNTMPVGSTRTISGYLYRKVSDLPNVPYTRNWKPEHIRLWERWRGPVPKGHTVSFKDGDHTRIRMSNLELLSRAELCVRNSIHNLPKSLVQVIMLNGALKRKIRNREKQYAEKQDIRSSQPPVRNSGGAEGRGEANGRRPRKGDQRRGANHH